MRSGQHHSSAVIDPGAEIGEGCEIGPYCVIGPRVVLGSGCKLHSHVVIDGETVLGKGNEIFPFAAIGLKTQDLKWRGGRTRTEIGDHNTFREHSTVHSATADGGVTRIGSDNTFLASTHVAHDATVGNRVIMSNVATLGGHVVVEDGAVIGGLGAVHQFCRIGRMAIVGGCSKVVQDVPPYMLVDGNPAETRSLNKVGLERHGVSEASRRGLKQAFRVLFREGLSLGNALARIEREIEPLDEVLHLIQFIRSTERGICK